MAAVAGWPPTATHSASAGRHRRMPAILPALDSTLEASESLRDIAQSPLDGSQASIQTGNLTPEETADREHR